MSLPPHRLSFSLITSLLSLGGQTQDTPSLMAPHRPRPCEVHAVCQALPHLVTEEADADTLQVLRGDLQGQGHQLKAMQPAHRTSGTSASASAATSPVAGLRDHLSIFCRWTDEMAMLDSAATVTKIPYKQQCREKGLP